MRIAVNTRLLISNRLDGIGWFAAETLKRIVEQHPEHEFYFLFDRKPDKQFVYGSNVHPVVLFPQARHPLLWYLFFEWSVTMALRRLKADLFVSPDGWLSLRTKVPTLTVIHDLNFEHSTDYLRPSHQRYMKHYFPLYAKRADRIATVSEFSKQDIARIYGVDTMKIDVVYDGSHSYYRPLGEEEKESVRRQYAGGKPFFIFVGTISKRKNLTNILLAFEKYKNDNSGSPMQMLVVGGRYWWGEELAETYEGIGHKDDVRFVGHADSEVLSQLMGASEALVYASLFEGFGIPIVEAFSAETAVITSDVTSMPEVAGDAAILVDPLSVEAIADAMGKVANDTALRNRLIARGRERRKLYSWDSTARLLWESIERVMDTINNKEERR